MMIYLLVMVVVFVAAIVATGIVLSGPAYRGPQTDHFNGRTFVNYGNAKAKGPMSVLKWLITRKKGKWPRNTAETFGKKPSTHVGKGTRISFINHSSFLIQTQNKNILIDPVFSERVSPFTFAGPRRMRAPGIPLDELPHIHYIFISHNHYDHLDMPCVQELQNRHAPAFIVPLGVKALLQKKGIGNVVEMDWWDEVRLEDQLTVRCAPAQHFSGRGMFDRDKTLWCGFVIDAASTKLYFTGDTAYNQKLFQQIKTTFGPFDLSIIPIGAYQPRWFMNTIHCSPDEAVQIHMDIQSRRSLACHFGTFPLADESSDDPVNDLNRAMTAKNLSLDDFTVLSEGSSLLLE